MVDPKETRNLKEWTCLERDQSMPAEETSSCARARGIFFSRWKWTIAAAKIFQELWRQVHSSRLRFLRQLSAQAPL